MTFHSRTLLLAAWGFGLAVYVVGQVGLIGFPYLEAAWTDLAWLLAAAAAAVSAWQAGRSSLLRSDARAWFVIMLACLLWLGGQLIWTWLELVTRQFTPFPSPADWFFLPFAPVFALGIALYRPLRGRPGVTVQQVCNLLILLCGLLIAVPLLLSDRLRVTQLPADAVALALVYLVVYLAALLFGFFCYGVFRWGPKRLPLLLLLLGIILHGLVTSAYCASLLDSTFSSGDSISIFWLIAFGFISWAALEYRLRRDVIATAGSDKAGRGLYVFDRLLPVGVIAVLVALVFWRHDDIDVAIMPWLLPPAALLVVVLAVREWFGYRADLAMYRASVAAAAALAASEQEAQSARRVAEEANRAKSQFLAHMSHELRTPLNAVIGFSEILTQQMFGPLGERYREYAASILDSGRHLLAVINDILDLSKVEAGHYELVESLVDIEGVTEQVRGLLREQLQAGRLELHVACDPDLPLVWGDERLLRQILLNLVGNAIKFTPAQGRISMRAELAEQGALRVLVQDSGIGMSEADLERALVPFGQASGVLARKVQGTGLGLPLARQFVRLHGGDLVIRSQPGKGTEIAVLVPPERLRQPSVAFTGARTGPEI
ncbi:ATP-binding protein [Ferrovibrio sp.]|uniref:sensor histidine kinase n=1 Tax=Ferrovibrio sp. TaxID=1917215 RepID=UPI00311EE21B